MVDSPHADKPCLTSLQLQPARANKEQRQDKVVMGLCAMEKKTRSKPMQAIVTRMLQQCEWLEVFTFPDDTILNEPVSKWPQVDAFLAFHSSGFPLDRAKEYVALRRPFVPNDITTQKELFRRDKTYEKLKQSSIEVPKYAVVRRDGNGIALNKFIEEPDSITIDGVVFPKPFVEKPLNADDHDIIIYFPHSAGGGSQALFRKVGNCSSKYSADNTKVRKDASYLYEQFMPTDGTDVKVYAVGPYYAHAEARKSPGLDGKVERNSEGKETRYPVILSNYEKELARKIVTMFKQTVCGFDLLRSNGKSYVCDVNGFSFVKSNNQYYDDASRVLLNIILRRFASARKIPWTPVLTSMNDVSTIVSTSVGRKMELRCLLAVIRHGDRTPKQKMKMDVCHPKFFQMFNDLGGMKKGELKLKQPPHMQAVLDLTCELMSEMIETADYDHEEFLKLQQIKMVLEMYGHFSGINRKIQMKYQPFGKGSLSSDTSCESLQTKPSILIILKWGGELTHAGLVQAQKLGQAFRTLYSDENTEHSFMRLHNTYRHDLKIYASDEGRVQMTAGAFAKGLLSLEGEITPILVQMVKSANTDGLLDDDHNARRIQNRTKNFLHDYLQQDIDMTTDDISQINPLQDQAIEYSLKAMRNPHQMCLRLHAMMDELLNFLRLQLDKHGSSNLYMHESLELCIHRWTKLLGDFRKHGKMSKETASFDISKIPDIYDSIKYDWQHNYETVDFGKLEEFFVCSKYMADIVVMQEYGITRREKLAIAQGICSPLLKKIQSDLRASAANIQEEDNETRLDPRYIDADIKASGHHRNVRTRLYFTSESHIHSLLNVFRYGEFVGSQLEDEQWENAQQFLSHVTEFNYMTQIVIMMYEDHSQPPLSPDRFHVELHFSSGAVPCVLLTHAKLAHLLRKGYRPGNKADEGTPAHKISVTMPYEGQDQKAVKQLRKDSNASDNTNGIDKPPSRKSESTGASPRKMLARSSTKPFIDVPLPTLSTEQSQHTVHKTQDDDNVARLSVNVAHTIDAIKENDATVELDAEQKTLVAPPTTVRRTSLPNLFKRQGSATDIVTETENVPEIRSLETLHNKLTYLHLNEFITGAVNKQGVFLSTTLDLSREPSELKLK